MNKTTDIEKQAVAKAKAGQVMTADESMAYSIRLCRKHAQKYIRQCAGDINAAASKLFRMYGRNEKTIAGWEQAVGIA